VDPKGPGRRQPALETSSKASKAVPVDETA